MDNNRLKEKIVSVFRQACLNLYCSFSSVKIEGCVPARVHIPKAGNSGRISEQELKNLFLHQKVQKTYTAIVRGIVKDDEREICAPILTQKGGGDLSIRSVISPMGKSARTRIRVIERDLARDRTLIEARPLTGRTHQIRVHLDSIQHPIVGDCLYGVSDEISRFFLESSAGEREFVRLLGAPHLMLNASRIAFRYDDKEFCIDSALRAGLLAFFYNTSFDHTSERVCR